MGLLFCPPGGGARSAFPQCHRKADPPHKVDHPHKVDPHLRSKTLLQKAAPPPIQIMLRDTVNKRAVHILLECILVSRYFSKWSLFSFIIWHKTNNGIVEYFRVTQFGNFYVKNYLRNLLPCGSLTQWRIYTAGYRYLYQSNNSGSRSGLKSESVCVM